MKIVDLSEAKANLEGLARECRSSPVVVTLDGKPVFEMVPFYSDDPEFVDRLLAESEPFRNLLEARRAESEAGKVSSLADIRKRFEEK